MGWLYIMVDWVIIPMEPMGGGCGKGRAGGRLVLRFGTLKDIFLCFSGGDSILFLFMTTHRNAALLFTSMKSAL